MNLNLGGMSERGWTRQAGNAQEGTSVFGRLGVPPTATSPQPGILPNRAGQVRHIVYGGYKRTISLDPHPIFSMQQSAAGLDNRQGGLGKSVTTSSGLRDIGMSNKGIAREFFEKISGGKSSDKIPTEFEVLQDLGGMPQQNLGEFFGTKLVLKDGRDNVSNFARIIVFVKFQQSGPSSEVDLSPELERVFDLIVNLPPEHQRPLIVDKIFTESMMRGKFGEKIFDFIFHGKLKLSSHGCLSHSFKREGLNIVDLISMLNMCPEPKFIENWFMSIGRSDVSFKFCNFEYVLGELAALPSRDLLEWAIQEFFKLVGNFSLECRLELSKNNQFSMAISDLAGAIREKYEDGCPSLGIFPFLFNIIKDFSPEDRARVLLTKISYRCKPLSLLSYGLRQYDMKRAEKMGIPVFKETLNCLLKDLWAIFSMLRDLPPVLRLRVILEKDDRDMDMFSFVSVFTLLPPIAQNLQNDYAIRYAESYGKWREIFGKFFEWGRKMVNEILHDELGTIDQGDRRSIFTYILMGLKYVTTQKEKKIILNEILNKIGEFNSDEREAILTKPDVSGKRLMDYLDFSIEMGVGNGCIYDQAFWTSFFARAESLAPNGKIKTDGPFLSQGRKVTGGLGISGNRRFPNSLFATEAGVAPLLGQRQEAHDTERTGLPEAMDEGEGRELCEAMDSLSVPKGEGPEAAEDAPKEPIDAMANLHISEGNGLPEAMDEGEGRELCEAMDSLNVSKGEGPEAAEDAPKEPIDAMANLHIAEGNGLSEAMDEGEGRELCEAMDSLSVPKGEGPEAADEA